MKWDMARWAELTLLMIGHNGGFCEQGNAENPQLWHKLGRNMWLIKPHYIHGCCIKRSLGVFFSNTISIQSTEHQRQVDEKKVTGRPKQLEEKKLPVPLRSPQIPYLSHCHFVHHKSHIRPSATLLTVSLISVPMPLCSPQIPYLSQCHFAHHKSNIDMVQLSSAKAKQFLGHSTVIINLSRKLAKQLRN